LKIGVVISRSVSRTWRATNCVTPRPWVGDLFQRGDRSSIQQLSGGLSTPWPGSLTNDCYLLTIGRPITVGSTGSNICAPIAPTPRQRERRTPIFI